MLTAGIVSLLFKLFRQPVVLGYIVAGMFAGPYVCGASWISDAESVETWGQIGVLFLLFAMGLEFSFKKLIAMGSTALISAATIVIGMMSVGFLAGRLMGWNEINSLFLGGMLCMSSTTIVFKAIEDMGLSSYKFASVAMGILIVEDLFAVVLMVLLSSIAVNQNFAGEELAMEIVKLIAYLVLWFVLGIYILPTFFRKFKTHLNDETLTIFAIGLCLGMVLLATEAGFSSALGAFVMGSILAETLEAERIEHLVQPIKNVFGSIFFVSVGMMLNPQMLADYWLPILIITLLVIFGQIFFASLGTLLSGQTLKVSLQTGFSLVQIGEFAFIIAGFGQSAGVTDSSLYPIVVAVSVITTFLTPYIMRMATPAEHYLNTHMSEGLRMMLENYYKRRNTISKTSLWKSYLRRSVTMIIVFGTILVFIYFIYFNYAYPWILQQSGRLEEYFTPSTALFLVKIVSLLLIIIISSPFLYGLVSRFKQHNDTTQLWDSGGYQRIYVLCVRTCRLLIATSFVGYAISHVFTVTSGVVFIIAFVFVISMRFSHRIRKHANSIAEKFNTNLTAREVQADKNRAYGKQLASSLLEYDLHIAEVSMPTNSVYSGKTLRELNIRKKSGASIVRVVRGGIDTNIPGGGKHLYPGDRIVVAGTDEQIDKFKQMIDNSVRKVENKNERTPVTLESFTVEEGSPLIGQSIMESGIREKGGCIVMGIERSDECLINPEPTIVIQRNDTILVAGEADRIKQFLGK